MKMATIFSAKYYQENKDCKKNLVKKNNKDIKISLKKKKNQATTWL